MRLVENGNLKEWVRIAFVIVGIVLVVGSVRIGLSSVLPKIVFTVGIIVAAVGGYASQAHMLKIKPFDNSLWLAVERWCECRRRSNCDRAE